MFTDMRDRLGLIAKEDSEREEEIGAPSILRIVLQSGLEITGFLSDGENGLDVQTLDLIEPADDVPGSGRVWVIAIGSIAAVHQSYPTEHRLAAAMKAAN